MPRGSFDSDRPLSNAQYQNANRAPYSSADYNNSTFYTPPKKARSKWLKIGLPILVLVLAGAGVGIYFALRHKNDDAKTSGNGGGKGGNGGGDGGNGELATATDSNSMPIYPSTTDTALFTSPTFLSNKVTWPEDSFKTDNPSLTVMRPDRPRLGAPSTKWAALPNLISSDPYLQAWNESIFALAEQVYPTEPKKFVIDGASGALDIAREVKLRIKALSYVYRMSNETKYLDRVWAELVNAANNGTDNAANPFGTAPDNWNSAHFLDLAEFTAAFAIAYDWLYDAWVDTQRQAIMWSILNLGLQFGIDNYNTDQGWWTKGVNGNWNCVCNGGLTMGALAILGDDPTGKAAQILDLTVSNAAQNCARGPSTDGTWSETPNYWYFGTTGHAEMSASLLTATGGTYGLLDANEHFKDTGLFHMHVMGQTGLFSWGDSGPNKFSSTANSVLFYGSQYQNPLYTLWQRDRADTYGDPWAIFWYDPTASGAFWDGLALDHYFEDPLDQWAAMRSSWTDYSGTYIGIKSGNHTGHQTHGDLDAGTFVIDAMGQRWAGEFGNGDYLSPQYFNSEAQDAVRWTYYRKSTQGQNVIWMNHSNQVVNAQPEVRFESTSTAQDSSTVINLTDDSTAYYTTDLTTTYSGTSYRRGIRFLNKRRQILLQDEINLTTVAQFRMHTNASVTLDETGQNATLELGGKTLVMQLLNAQDGVKFETGAATRDTDPSAPQLIQGASDQPNDGVTVVLINLNANTNYNLQILFNPQWDGMSAGDFVVPPSVAIDNWNLQSHSSS